MRHELWLQLLPWESCPTDGACDAESCLGAFYAIDLGPYRIEDATRENMGIFAVRVTRQEKKLLAAPADYGIGKPGRRADTPRDLDQNLVSNLVPEQVVDSLEVVDVNHIEHEVSMARVRRLNARKRTQNLLHVGFDRIG